MKKRRIVFPVTLLLVISNINPCVAKKRRQTYIVKDTCLNAANRCAIQRRYTKCQQTKENENNCSFRSFCSVEEYNTLLTFACLGEKLLRALADIIDILCVRRLESAECNLGIVNLTIFDYGNETQKVMLCEKIQSSRTERCIVRPTVMYTKSDCTIEQYGQILKVLCSFQEPRVKYYLELLVLCVLSVLILSW